jgi:chromosome segregation ATPase
MSDNIDAFFQLLQSRFGLHPSGAATVALFIALLLAILSLYLFAKLRGLRAIVYQVVERLGYEPPYGNLKDIFEEEFPEGMVGRDAKPNVEELEQRVRALEGDGEDKLVELTALHRRSKELDDQLQQARAQNDKAAALAVEQTEAHRIALEQLEQRMRDVEAESSANLATAQQRARELEDKLQQANLWSDKVTALANDQAQAHQKALEQLEQRMRDKEAEHIADLTATQRRSKDLEDQLQQAAFQNEQATAQASEQAQAHQITVSQFEERIRQMEAEGSAFVAALERRAKELEEQLHQALFHNDQLSAQAEEQAKAHRMAVEQLEQRTRDMEAESNAYLAPLQQRSKELEEQLQRAAVRHERVTAESGEQMQAYRTTVDDLEQRLREMEAEGVSTMAALQQRSKDLEDQLQRARILNEKLSAQAGEQAQAHLVAVEQLEQRMRAMEAEGDANIAALRQRSKDLEDQLQQAAIQHESVRVQAGEQAQADRTTVEQLEQRIREMEAASAASLTAVHERSRGLEDQLQQASVQNDRLTAQAGEQAQAHRATVDQFEQRIREVEAASIASLTAAQERSQYLEDQLQQAMLKSESEKLSVHQEALERSAGVEQLELRIHGLEAEKDARESHLKTLEEHVKELDNQLQQAASRMPAEKAKVAVNASEQFMRRAEWITACAVGSILPYGLVAAEAHASAALIANPQSTDAPQLLAELARIHRAYPEGLPSVVEAVTTFDERTAAYFAGNLSRAADIAEDEAQRRYRAGLNRSALLVVNVALELRQKTEGENGPGTLRLQALKETLLARLGSIAKPPNVAPGFASE